MILQQGIVAALLAATGVQAGIGALIAEGMTRNSPSYERRMQEIAKRSIAIRGLLETRQTQGNQPVINPDGTINMTAWDAQANAACVTALRALPEASNPSGTAVCYNLPALDQNSGTFEADLRVYRLGVPTGDFAGIPPENVEVGLRYRGASVSPISANTAARGIVAARSSAPEQVLVEKRQSPAETNGDLQLLQTYLFVGQIDETEMRPEMSM